MRQPKWNALVLAFGLWFSWPSAEVRALDPARELSECNCVSWTLQNGLPPLKIRALAQTQDGYLWLGTDRGLVRFDGVEFTLVGAPPNSQGHQTSIQTLLPARDGGLWFGLKMSGYGRLGPGREWWLAKDAAASSDRDVKCLLEAANGTLWSGGVQSARWKQGGNSVEPLFTDQDGTFAVLSLLQDSNGGIWVGTNGRGLYYWKGGKLTRVAAPEMDSLLITAMAEDRDGQVWFCTHSGLIVWDRNWHRVEVVQPHSRVSCLLADRHGVLWMGTTDSGLARCRKGVISYLGKADGLSSDTVLSLAEDHEGSLWVGTVQGLDQLKDVKLRTIGEKEGLPIGTVLSVSTAPQGGLWIGTATGAVRWNRGQATTYSTNSGLAKGWVKRVLESRNGDVFMLSGENRIEVLSAGKLVARHATTGMPVAMVEDSQGVVVSVGGELLRVSRNHLVPFAYKADRRPELYWIVNLSLGRDDSLWVASVNGICRIKDGEFKQWTQREGLTDSRVNWVFEEADGTVWAALSGRGLSRLRDDHIGNVRREDGLFDEDLQAALTDNHGRLWISSSLGLFTVQKRNVEEFLEGKVDRVTCLGYESPDAVKPADSSAQEASACSTPDGRLWFPNGKGLVMVDPEDIPTNAAAPPVHIQTVRVNGMTFPLTNRIVAKPGRGELEFSYAGLSYRAPYKVRYRYRLEGCDPDWVEAGNRRGAFYANLKPRDYVLRVVAANADGVWNLSGDSLRIRLLPHFYQTAWFSVSCFVGAALSLLGGYRWRIQSLRVHELRLREARDALETRVNERTSELAALNAALRQEVDERTRAQERSREIEQRLRAIYETSPDAIGLFDEKADIVLMNPSAAVMFGYRSAREMVGSNALEFFQPQDRERVAVLIRAIFETGAQRDIHFKLRKKDGTEFPAEFSCSALYQADGAPSGIIAVARNIADRQRAEEAMRASEARFSAVFHHSPIAISLSAISDGEFVDVNDALLDLSGFSRSEVIGHTSLELNLWPTAADRERFIRRLSDGERGMQTEARLRRKSGEFAEVLITAHPLQVGDQTYVLGMVLDITERKQLEERLRQSQKMEGVGRLAGGMAHEFNNLLAAMMLNLELARMAPPREAREMMGETVGVCQRGAELIKQLLAFSRQSVMRREPVDLGSSVARQSRTLASLLGERWSLSLSIADGLPQVSADAVMIEQVLMNLCLNARDAMRGGGAIQVALATVDVGPEQAPPSENVQPGRFVCLSVADAGCGMDEGTLRKLFEPFFTTKEVGQGTGLGLATVRGIVQQHHGWVHVESQVGKGSTFRVYLPALASAVTPMPAVAPNPALPQGTGTILLVEDEAALRIAARNLLRGVGYRVFEAAHGSEALELWQEHRDAIDLVYTDMVMPGELSGLDLAKRVMADKPGVKVIVTSGYNSDLLDHEKALQSGFVYLSKPCVPNTLITTMQQCLGSR